MITIISGGQTGVDRGALDAALQRKVSCSGWCPPGRIAEDGVIPPRYPLTEMAYGSYRERTRRNAEDSDATLILAFGTPEGGTLETQEFCKLLHKPVLTIDISNYEPKEVVGQIVSFIKNKKIQKLNVAGPRASKQPTAAEITHAIIAQVLGELSQK